MGRGASSGDHGAAKSKAWHTQTSPHLVLGEREMRLQASDFPEMCKFSGVTRHQTDTEQITQALAPSEMHGREIQMNQMRSTSVSTK